MAKKTAQPKARPAATKKTRPAKKASTAKSAPKKSQATPAKKPPAKKTTKPVTKKPIAKKPVANTAVKSKAKTAGVSKLALVKQPKNQPKPAAAAKTARKSKAKAPPKSQPAASVDSYIATLNDWRKECVASLRKMIQKAAPGASEKVEGEQPVYEHHGPLAWIKAHAKDVHLGFWRGVELPDPRKLLSGAGDRMRHIKLSSLKDAGKQELEELIRVAAKLNEAQSDQTPSDSAQPEKAKVKQK